MRYAADGELVACSRAFAIEFRREALSGLLRELCAELGVAPGDRHAITMTAELSQVFRNKREGVACVLTAVAESLGAEALIFTTTGGWLSTAEAMQNPLAVAASNWAATARLVAREHPDSLLIDIGSTTTDLIPILNGEVRATGLSDPARLASGELIYTGVLRTPVEAVVRVLPWRGGNAGVSAEGFALTGDAYLWLGELEVADYTAPTPDRRPTTRGFSGERLARTICADREMLSDVEIETIARAIADAQVALIADGIRNVLARHPDIRIAVVTGLGDFVAHRAAERAGLEVVRLADRLGEGAARVAPAAAVAILASGVALPARKAPLKSIPPAVNGLVVIKVGGGVSDSAAALTRIGQALARVAARHRIVVIPGGGPFADSVRDFDAAVGLSPGAAHWMAILGMDQLAYALADTIPGAELVDGQDKIASVHSRAGIPVLAPSRWLRSADELPHTWSVTSDSLTAYLAGLLGADKLVLIKPVSGGLEVLDPYFTRALPDGIQWWCISVDEVDQLEERLNDNEAGSGE